MDAHADDAATEKQALRRDARARRATVPPGEQREAALRLAKGLPRHPLVTRLEPGAVLVPTRHGDEIDTEPLALALEDEGWQLHRPRSVVAGRGLDVIPWASHAPLIAGAHDVPEPPPEAQSVPVDVLTLILVPGLGFSLDGARLGSGIGYFDRFLGPLASLPRPPVLIGIGYRVQLRSRIPMASHDVRVQGLQLEEQAITCAQRAAQG